MMYVNDINHDEIRSGFLVTSDRKKLWNTQIGCILELQRVCEKYNLRYFAAYGTLLGAARHQGFIPWDDDVDVCMFRSDYEKLKSVAYEFQPPYRLDIWYNNIEPNDDDIGWPRLPFIKLRDTRTTSIEVRKHLDLHNEIGIDIFPITPAPPFENHALDVDFRTIQDIFIAVCRREDIKNIIENHPEQLFLPLNTIEKILTISFNVKGKFLDDLLAKFEHNSKFVIVNNLTNLDETLERAWFNEMIYLPFENVQIPAPKNYDDILKVHYNDYHKFVISPKHTDWYSPNISYEDFRKQLNF